MPDWTIWAAAIPIGLLTTFELLRDSRRLSVWLLIPALVCLYYLVQLIPMPITFLGYISPSAAALYADVGATKGTLSLNRYETMLSVGLQSIFACALFLGTRISGRQVRQVLTILGGAIALMSVLGWLHLVLGWTAVFNVYQPDDIPNPKGFVTAFVNANTAASFLCLGVALNLGLTFEQSKATRARLTMFGAYLCATGVVLTQSKGGLIALFCVIFVWIYSLFLNPKNYRIRERLPYRITLLWFLIPSIIMGLVLLMFLPDVDSAEGWTAAFERKLEVWHAVEYLKDYWVTGSGRGTFEVVYPIYQTTGIQGTVTHAENLLFQLISETGLIVGLTVIAWGLMLCRYMMPKVLTSFRPLKWSLWGAIVGITIQQMVDFGLESVGLTIPFALCLGRILRYQTDVLPLKKTLVVVALCPLTLLVFHFGLPNNPISKEALTSIDTCGTVDGTMDAVQTLAVDAPSDYLIFETGLRTLARCHPQEWQRTLELARRAQERHPTRGTIRLLTGELMAKHGHLAQAAVEFRAALTWSPWLWEHGRTPIQHYLIKEPDLLFEAVSDNDRFRSGMFGYLMVKEHLDTAQVFLNAWVVAGLPLEESNRRQALLCVRQASVSCLVELERRYRKKEMHGQANVLLAWQHYLNGELTPSAQALKAGKTHIRDVGLGFAILGQRLATKLRNIELARIYIQQQWEKSVTPAARASTLLTQSRIETDLGDPKRAIKALNLAYRLQPSIQILLRAFSLEYKLKDLKACKLRLSDIRKAYPTTPQLKVLEKKYETLKQDVDASQR